MKSLNDKSGRVRLLLNFSGPILRQVFSFVWLWYYTMLAHFWEAIRNITPFGKPVSWVW